MRRRRRGLALVVISPTLSSPRPRLVLTHLSSLPLDGDVASPPPRHSTCDDDDGASPSSRPHPPRLPPHTTPRHPPLVPPHSTATATAPRPRVVLTRLIHLTRLVRLSTHKRERLFTYKREHERNKAFVYASRRGRKISTYPWVHPSRVYPRYSLVAAKTFEVYEVEKEKEKRKKVDKGMGKAAEDDGDDEESAPADPASVIEHLGFDPAAEVHRGTYHPEKGTCCHSMDSDGQWATITNSISMSITGKWYRPNCCNILLNDRDT